MDTFVFLTTDGPMAFLKFVRRLPDATTEDIAIHPVPRARLVDLVALDQELLGLGYSRLGDWESFPGGAIAKVSRTYGAASKMASASEGRASLVTSPAKAAGPRVIAQTYGSIAHTSWDYAHSVGLVGGQLFLVVTGTAATLQFNRRDGPIFRLPLPYVYGVTRRAAGLNVAIDVYYTDEAGQWDVVCMVGPRGRMKRIFGRAGHPL